MPKVSVVVPIYKVEDYLERCLESIVNQTLKDLEIILVDEGDHDRCREIIDEFAAKDSRIIALHDKHGGYGNSVNAGIDKATGEYIGIVESDDFIELNMYELLYARAKETDADVVKSSFYYYHNDAWYFEAPMMSLLKRTLPKKGTFTFEEHPAMISTHPSIWAGIYNTEWLKSTGIKFLSKGAYLDIQFRFETLMAARKIAWIDDELYYWYLDNPNSTNAVWNTKAAIERWEFIHSKFEGKPELWKKFAPYALPEENVNLFIRYNFGKLTGKQRKKIRQFCALYPDEVIKKCPYVNGYDKKWFLLGNLNILALKRFAKRILKSEKIKIAAVFVWLLALSFKDFNPLVFKVVVCLEILYFGLRLLGVFIKKLINKK